MNTHAKTNILLVLFLFLTVPLFAERIDTRTNITNFFKLSQNDFEINSKATLASERQAYTTLRAADIDGGAPDGKITYFEYLSQLNRTTPSSVTPQDFALSQMLPLLRDFAFGPVGQDIGTGVLTQPWIVNSQVTIPAGARVELKVWGSVRTFAKSNFEAQGLLISGNGATAQLDFSGSRFYLSACQIARDALIGGVPCKSVLVSGEEPTLTLHDNGAVYQAILSATFSRNDVSFLPGERVALSSDGALYAAVLLQSRVIQDRQVTSNYIEGNPQGGFWGGICPHVFFDRGKVVAAYEENKEAGNIPLWGDNQYQYGGLENRVVTSIVPTSGYFLGYPVVLPNPQETWNWRVMPGPITVASGKAAFIIDIPVQISGSLENATLPAGAQLVVDITTGNCLSVVYTDGRKGNYEITDQMKPAQLSPEEQSVQILRWMDEWLAAHPEAADGSNRDVRQKHIVVRDRMLAIEKKTARSIQFMRFLDNLLLYKDRTAGLTVGNIALDVNGDGRIQDTEYVPASLFEGATGAVLSEKIFAFFMEKADKLPLAKLRLLGTVMATMPIASADEDLGVFDKLGAILSKAGVHPFAAKKIYYFPNGSGDKALCRTIEFYPTGVPKKLMIDTVGKPGESIPFTLSIPNSVNKISINLYNSAREDEAIRNISNSTYWSSRSLSMDYWTNINTLEFHETGALAGVLGTRYAPMPMTPETGSQKNPQSTHRIRWTPEGKILEMYPGEDNIFDLPGGLMVASPALIKWWGNAAMAALCFVEVHVSTPITVAFKKGENTLFKIIDKANGTWQPYIKNFDKDTNVVIYGGFYMDAAGHITYYW